MENKTECGGIESNLLC